MYSKVFLGFVILLYASRHSLYYHLPFICFTYQGISDFSFLGVGRVTSTTGIITASPLSVKSFVVPTCFPSRLVVSGLVMVYVSFLVVVKHHS